MSTASALPLTIFALTYLALALGRLPYVRLDRTGAATVGAIAMVLTGTLSEGAAGRAVDFHTLGLLLGMMILVADLRQSGVFAYVAHTVFRRARTGYGLLALIVAVSGVLAAFFVNDVVCLILAPLLTGIAADTGIDAVPLLLGLATATNIGSAATITGNPQNMIVAGFAKLRYVSFLRHVGPSAVVGLILDFGVIALVYRASLKQKCKARADDPPRVPSRLLAIKSSLIALGALVGFALGFRTDLVALSAASVVLLIGHSPLGRIYDQVDYTLLLMFAGLFIVVGGAETTGFHKQLLHLIGAGRLNNPAILTGTAAVLSNLVSNVPAVMLFRPLYPLLGHSARTGMLLAAASTYAGNLTLLGSVANLIVVENARAHGVHLSFGEHLKVGLPITLLTLALATVMVR